jgi:uncharacterized membrane protein YciS (DUF1049 family)
MSYFVREEIAMNFKDSSTLSWLVRVGTVLAIVSSVFSMFLVRQLNGIVHGSLYNYGLQFNYGWAVAYWNLEGLLYVTLALPAVFGSTVLTLEFWKGRMGVVPVVRQVAKMGINGKTLETAKKETSMLISCPKCKKVFSKPLNMLDFSHGKTRLINVCPYCNHTLGNADDNCPDVSVEVAEPEEVSQSS